MVTLIVEPNGIWDGLLGAVIGALVTGGLSAGVFAVQLHKEAQRRKAERAEQLKSLATALFCEIGWFYYSAMFFNIQAGLSNLNEKLPISFIRPPLNFVTFTVFESNADKIGLFHSSTAEKLVEFVYDAKLYLAFAQEHKRRLNERDNGGVPYHDEAPIQETLRLTAEDLDKQFDLLSKALKAVAQIK
jgi:hypothetical protein